ncbi:5-methyltetrahydropteroyltriglutamate--homocysteine S-methyltransferase [Microbulbifer thermotolerans]|uniref:5-methyltetrahydropteroyltriglutamate-- homocysteine S-methyltransferase n=1 Tax=Microbulbifer thermotolerans TaxID=252514 RepID=UPI00224B4BCE|nr:5-methyltetrahydropteroyltriglutamate--homocysteine S-methyltransferase [Microbulbifer thermotolerans]MCX2781149.1 5-methyltetrahydropteroyltriglutamate--homocysteine S-methyltransferase [Microbulbifer thermotolerans]MCX2804610.1 5-methyltetrahydropteroyltriglutamate--homocysteine S-methyltransferase [Microbulbifer thermotolerans]
MALTHILGYPRIGAGRELKKALEAYWRGDLPQRELLAVGAEIRRGNWQAQKEAGLELVTVGDFAWYDQVLNHTLMFGAVPPRFDEGAADNKLDQYFRIARGRAPSGTPVAASAMTKWFDTNYHYLVPEFTADQNFALDSDWLLTEVQEARSQGHNTKAVVIGPLTYLWLGRAEGDALALLPKLLPCYTQLLRELAEAGVEWVQLDEPILGLDLSAPWRDAFAPAYRELDAAVPALKLLLATYFSSLQENLPLAFALPVDGVHIDCVRAPEELSAAVEALGQNQVLSAGVLNGRNVWRGDLASWQSRLKPIAEQLGDRLWLSASCSLLHCPVDLETETGLPAEQRQKLAYSRQKLEELKQLQSLLQQDAVADPSASAAAVSSSTVLEELQDTWRPQSYAERAPLQAKRWQLPLLPTTTIGSFPQTDLLRKVRKQFRSGEISEQDYRDHLRAEIAEAIRRQEILGLDVLVHGEAERNDMVEYFGEQLEGFVHTGNGWVQSYGSRCVKPPIIFGDISRPKPMTVEWISYAQSLTKKPVKGMLTGPVTILNWSFPREDIPRAESCLQIAKALRQEVLDLEEAGIGIIQIDEPALREGVPLRESEHKAYFDWAVACFRYTCSQVKPETQIHTHMCYSNFNAIMDAIVALDADVITIESSRSDLQLLHAFSGEKGGYPNEIGPGVYDIHSPNVPQREELVARLKKILQVIPLEKLWVNPDCGLKTRNWAEVGSSLLNMVEAARTLRAELA